MQKQHPDDSTRQTDLLESGDNLVLIIGIDSQIGSAVSDYLKGRNFEVFGTTRRRDNVDEHTYYLDLENPEKFSPNKTFSAVVFCAGVTSIAMCEDSPHESEKINVLHTKRVIDAISATGAYLLFLSTNAVFDGTVPFSAYTDSPNPQSKYGKFKLAVESHVQHHTNGRGAVLRLTKVVSESTGFIQNWNRAADLGKPILAFSDKLLSPVSLELVLDAVSHLVMRRTPGVFHLGGSEELSYFDYAKKYFSEDPEKLKLIHSANSLSNPDSPILHNSLSTFLPTKEFQYQELLKTKRLTMGLMSGYGYLHDPKRLTFTLSRYKFVSKMLAGLNEVLEVGCADAFGTPLILQEVRTLVACDFDPVFIDDAKRNHPFSDKISFVVHNMVEKPIDKEFDGVFSLDVLEHICAADEDRFMQNIAHSLKADGVCLIGMPSLESQVYASEVSKQGHVNCKTGPQLKSFLSRHFQRVFSFSMNDEVMHTGYFPMAQYLICLCCFPIKAR